MITFEPADPQPDSHDSQCIWQWRNDPMTRQMSLSTDEIPWDRHRAWYAQAARDESKVLLVARHSDDAIGMVRFDRRGSGEAEISINLNPVHRGQGLGKALLVAACDWGCAQLGLVRIAARIKPDNLRSLHIFSAAGFVLQSQDPDYHAYLLTPRKTAG